MGAPESSCSSVHYSLTACSLRKNPCREWQTEIWGALCWPESGWWSTCVLGRKRAARIQTRTPSPAFPPDQHRPTEPRQGWKCSWPALSRWVLSRWKEANETEELNFSLYASLIDLNVNSYMTTVWVTGPHYSCTCLQKENHPVYTEETEFSSLPLDPEIKLPLSFNCGCKVRLLQTNNYYLCFVYKSKNALSS